MSPPSADPSILNCYLHPVARRGIGSIEYAIVLTLVCLFSVAAIVVLGESTRSSVSGLGDVLVNREARTDIADAQSNPGDRQNQAALATDTRSTLHYKLFTAASSICIIAFALTYIRQGHRLQQHKAENESEVKLLLKHSIALQKVVAKRSRIHNSMRDDWNRLAGDGCKVGEFMSTDVVTIDCHMAIADAEKMLREMGYRRVIVTREKDCLAGVLSLKDISTKSGNIVADVMTREPRTATPDTDLQIALSMMLQNRISCLPVVESNKLLGLISTSDMLMVLQCMLVSMDSEPAPGKQRIERTEPVMIEAT